MSGLMFGVIPTGQQLMTDPTSTPSPTSFLYTLPNTKSFSHVMVILLPNVHLPENTAAAIYLATAKDVATAAELGGTPNFKFLGGIGTGKESALFKISSNPSHNSGSAENDGVVIGVSVEPAESIGQRLEQLSADKTANSSAPNPSTSQLPTTLLAQRIIQNAYNSLASYTKSIGPEGVEVVPLRAFDEWWRKFESRIRNDPNFLAKPQE
ncbi:DUF775 domain protein [Metarhizium album ARSEF 1941]|uniref:DUF775 domain protein n=1 Tax=Metarhizium album (strain ARSEF 1941) TaxID=1081103 RepID=A0A0B2WZ51_METAS|nr:DUF775 domain protein [Metarhizium album ARSEF 1941]KHN99288.1 DUF775 domain protein [Metarhizium album ARSEF 1941]